MFNEGAMKKLGGLKQEILGTYRPKKETKKQFIERMEARHDAAKQAKKEARRNDKKMREATIARDKNLRNREK